MIHKLLVPSLLAVVASLPLMFALRLPPRPPLSRLTEGEQVVRASVIVAGEGAGVLVRDRGRLLILTAWHVVEDVPDKRNIPVRFWGDGLMITGRAVLHHRSLSHDLAILDLPSQPDLPHIELARDPPKAGAEVWYCGFGSKIPFHLVRSIVNRADREQTMVNGEGWFGHSGSAMIEFRGGKPFVVGIITNLAVDPPQSNPKSPLIGPGVGPVRGHVAWRGRERP